jgi:hypothetical protein
VPATPLETACGRALVPVTDAAPRQVAGALYARLPVLASASGMTPVVGVAVGFLSLMSAHIVIPVGTGTRPKTRSQEAERGRGPAARAQSGRIRRAAASLRPLIGAGRWLGALGNRSRGTLLPGGEQSRLLLSGCSPLVSMMEPADQGDCRDSPHFRRLCRPWLRSADKTSLIPMAFTCSTKSSPKTRSRSRDRQRGALSHGTASRSCWAVHSAVGRAVTLKCTIGRDKLFDVVVRVGAPSV